VGRFVSLRISIYDFSLSKQFFSKQLFSKQLFSKQLFSNTKAHDYSLGLPSFEI